MLKSHRLDVLLYLLIEQLYAGPREGIDLESVLLMSGSVVVDLSS